MSGKKRSQISVNTGDNINRVDRKINKSNYNNKRKRKEMKKSLEIKREERLKKLQQKLEKETSKNIKKLQKNIDKKLSRQEKDFDEKLESQREEYFNELDNLEGNINQKIEKQGKIINQKLKDQKDELINYVDFKQEKLEEVIEEETINLQNQINDINEYLTNKIENEQQISKEWLNRLENILENIKENYDYQKFAPEETQRIERGLTRVKEFISQNQYQSATSRASDNFEKANQLLYKLELLTMEWEETLLRAESQLEELLEIYDENKRAEIELPTKSGKKGVAEIEADVWASDQRKKIQKEISDIESKLANPNNLSKEEIVSLIEQMNNLFYQIDISVDKAIARFKHSIQSRDIQEIIANKLETMGFQVEANLFENDDERNANVLLMKKRNEKILTRIDYDEENNMPEFNINFNSSDENIRQDRLEVILKAINEELGTDLAPETMTAEEGYENRAAEEQAFNIEKIKNKKEKVKVNYEN